MKTKDLITNLSKKNSAGHHRYRSGLVWKRLMHGLVSKLVSNEGSLEDQKLRRLVYGTEEGSKAF
ncbi:MAG: hypothetical protein HZA74_01205 [Ignavibacteriales bacterium]|nr:hypothetical protein [Ignavibacteriales bacterium]